MVSRVTVREMQDAEINALLDTGEYEGKSGAYMVQVPCGNTLQKIEGSVDSIVGLPVAEILDCMERKRMDEPVKYTIKNSRKKRDRVNAF